LTDVPADANLHPHGSLRLTCRTNLTVPVAWLFTKEGTDEQPLTRIGDVLASFRGLFEIDESNKYDLIATMTNDTEPYCGEYRCVDFDGRGEDAKAIVSSKFVFKCSG